MAPSVENAAYFLVSEALTNVAKHSKATFAHVRVERRSGHLLVQVSDDGIGGAHAGKGSGLEGLAGRIAGLDGVFTVASPDGGPTVVEAAIPVDGPAADE